MPNRSAPCLSASVEVASSGVHRPSGVPTELTRTLTHRTLATLGSGPRPLRTTPRAACARLAPSLRLSRQVADPGRRPAGSPLAVQSYAAQLRPLLAAIDTFEAQIATVFAAHPDHELFASFPGAGAVCAPRLAAAFGTVRSRWDTAFSAWARAYYDQQRGRGNDHHAALRSLAFKWMRILFRCCADSTGQCNSVSEYIRRRSITECLAWPRVERACDLV